MAELSKREYDEVRSWLVQAVAETLGYPETSVVTTGMQCVQRGCDVQTTTDALSRLLDDGAPQLAGRLFEKIRAVKVANIGAGVASQLSAIRSKRSVKEAFAEDGNEETGLPLPKRPKPSLEPVGAALPFSAAGPAAAAPVGPAPGLPLPLARPSLDTSQISDLMARTRAQIEEKKAALLNQQRLPFIQQALAAQQAPGLIGARPAGMPPGGIPPPVAAAMGGLGPLQQAAMDAERKKAELQQRIQAQLAGANLRAAAAASSGAGAKSQPAGEKPAPLILDSDGRTIDAAGKAISLTSVQTTLKANIRAKQRENFKIEKPTQEELIDNNPYYDPRVSMAASQRSKRSFKFHEAGKFQQLAQKLRAKKQLERLQESIASVAKKTGISSATKLALITPAAETVVDLIPDIEWWDKVILPTGERYDTVTAHIEASTSGASMTSSGNATTGDASSEVAYRNITQLIEHPVPYFCKAQKKPPPILAVQLTKHERKKLRTQRRREAEKEKQEQISLGLMPAPPPKVKMSNLMRVLGSEAVQDPTKMEAYVRGEMAKRQRAHESDNAARKLTPEQRKDKKLKKLDEDLTGGVDVQVYRITDLSDPKVRYKVDINAQQLHLTGCIVQSRDLSVVVVEGGPNALKKYKRLMMHRINWDEARRNMEKNLRSDNTDQPNQCCLVWEGMVEARNFVDWRCKQIPAESGARDFLHKYNVQHYWDLAFSSSIIESADD